MSNTTIPEAWSTLIAAITLLAKHPSNEGSPFHCEHDTLHVMADDELFTLEEIAQLDEWGFHVDGDTGGFYSFEYRSA